MQNLGQALLQAANQNNALLQVLAQTDYSLSSLKQNTGFIENLNVRITETDKKLKNLHAITEDERKDHVKYRDSTVKRFAYKLGGQKGKDKFVSRAEKEEREFLEAWQAERETIEAREELGRALRQAESDRVNLEADKGRNEAAQKELDALYQSIFSGPTPELPQEDHMENAVHQSREHFNERQTQFGKEMQAMDALQRADASLDNARNAIQEAHSASSWDVMGGGTFADMMERDALSRTQMFVFQTKQYIEEAQRAQPAIRSLGKVDIDTGHLMSDVVFDNIFSDMAQHDRIKSSESQIERSITIFRQEVAEQRQRKQIAKGQLQQAAEDLEVARKELQRIRAEAFENYAGSAPPSYQE